MNIYLFGNRISGSVERSIRSLGSWAGITGDEIGEITPEMLRSGAWKGRSFRAYNIQVPPSRALVGRRNPY